MSESYSLRYANRGVNGLGIESFTLSYKNNRASRLRKKWDIRKGFLGEQK